LSIFLGILFVVHKNPKLVCYYPVNDPKISLDHLDSYEKGEVDFIEIGLKTNNPFLDGILIKESMKRSLGAGYLEECQSTINAINKMKSKPRKVLFMYTNKKLLNNNTMWHNFDIILCPGRLGFTRDNILLKAKTKNVLTAEFIKYRFNDNDIHRAKSASSYVMLQYLRGKTGIRFDFDLNLSKRINRLRENGLTKPIFLGVGISTIDQIKHILDSGADGIVLGSILFKAAINGNNFLTDFLCKIKETLNGE